MVKTYTKNDLNVRLSDHYTVGDLWLKKSLDKLIIDTDLVMALEKFWAHFGKPPQFYSENAIYCLNAHSGNSYHYKGMAADFGIAGVEPYKLAQYAEQIGMGGIGLYSDSNRHIHMDTRPKRTLWWIVTSKSNTPGFGGVPCIFKQGSRSYAIKEIQAFLNARGFDCGKADGIFGAKTKAALVEYQKSVGLKPDGIYGKDTNRATGIFPW